MFIAILFTVARRVKQPKYPSTDERVKKTCYVSMLKYYSIVKKNEIRKFARKWIEDHTEWVNPDTER